MARWILIKERAAQKFIESLRTQDQEVLRAFNTAQDRLADSPYINDHPATAIAHLKGEFHCHWEYRRLPNNRRIYFKIFTREQVEAHNSPIRRSVEWDDDDQLGVVVIFFAGPHPK